MTNITQKDYNSISIYRLKNKNFALKELLQACLPLVMYKIYMCKNKGESTAYYQALYNKICRELNIKCESKNK